MTRRLSPELLTLLDSILDTFEKVDIVSYLHDTGGQVSMIEIQARIQLDDESMRKVVADLVRSGIVTTQVSSGSIALGPRAADADFTALMTIYRDDRLVVISALTSIAMGRIRTMAAQTYAERFSRRPKKPEEE